MRSYTTPMDAARQGIITPEMEAVAKAEYRTPEEIRELVAKGQAVICANRLHAVQRHRGQPGQRLFAGSVGQAGQGVYLRGAGGGA